MFKKILCIGDLHSPNIHKDAIPFLKKVIKEYGPFDKVIQIGDELESNSQNFHNGSDPDGPSAKDELELAILSLRPFYKLFPKVDLLFSNHGDLFLRRVKAAKIPINVLKDRGDILQSPKGWNWYRKIILNTPQGRVLFHHGLGTNALKVSQHKGMSYVGGHYHTQFSLSYWQSEDNKRMFAIQLGTLIDFDSQCFNYARNNLCRPQLGCAVIINGIPTLIPMILKGDSWIGKV